MRAVKCNFALFQCNLWTGIQLERFGVICDSFQLIMCDVCMNEVIRETCFIVSYFVNDEIGSRH